MNSQVSGQCKSTVGESICSSVCYKCFKPIFKDKVHVSTLPLSSCIKHSVHWSLKPI